MRCAELTAGVAIVTAAIGANVITTTGSSRRANVPVGGLPYVRNLGRGPTALSVVTNIYAGTRERGRAMHKWSNTYTAYSVACAAVWAVILAVVSTAGGDATRRTFLLVFGGWVIGWLSATIARAVYPPPKRGKHIGT